MDHQNQQPYQQYYTQPQNASPQYAQPQSTSNLNSNNQTVIINTDFAQKQKNKWVALILCFFFGFLGAHKFYEEKTGLGILYLLTCGLCGIGVIIDFIALLFKPTQYRV